jgi:small conductance mechanosensitive channel
MTNLTWADVKDYAWIVGPKLAVALAIFVVGRWISKAVLRGLIRLMERGDVDISLRKFLGDVAYASMFVVVVIASLDTIGVKTTAIVAVLGAAGLAVGLALQGSLSNFAAGVMLILQRPYKVGDLVVLGKYMARVEAIKVFHTIVVTGDHREVSIPNGLVISQPIENLTALGRRRVDLVVSVAQASDLARVRELLEGVLAQDERIHRTGANAIDVAEITDSSVKLYLRPWTSVEHHAKVAADTMERIKTVMEAAGLKYSVLLQAGA